MPISYDTDWGNRNATLLMLANDVVAAGGTVTAIDPRAGETHPNWLKFLNSIIAGANGLGLSPPIPLYQSLDRNAFQSVVNNILARVALAPPVNTAVPVASVVTGGTVAGTSVLTCTLGTWTPPPPATTLTRQWLSNGVIIPGQTGATYASVPGDSGHSISCGVVATNDGGTNGITSNSIALT